MNYHPRILVARRGYRRFSSHIPLSCLYLLQFRDEIGFWDDSWRFSSIAREDRPTDAFEARGMGLLDQQLRRHCRDPCPADHHRDSEGQNDESRDGPDTTGPNGDSYKGGEEEHARCHRVDRPSSLSLGYKAARKDETR